MEKDEVKDFVKKRYGEIAQAEQSCCCFSACCGLPTVDTAKKIGFFVSSGDAGDQEKYQKAKIEYIENVLANYPNVKPIATEAFSGRIKVL